MPSSTRPIAAVLLVVAAAVAFWSLALSPKRHEADKLAAQIEQLNGGIEAAQSEVDEATTARRSFPAAYRQLVEVGQAVPAGSETPSLLIELEKLATESGVKFQGLQFSGEGGSEEPAESAVPTESAEASSTAAAPATEVEASLLPLGASIGSAGLGVMPYNLQFKGNFFQIAAFIGKVDDLVGAKNATDLTVNGRLITINGFTLSGGDGEGEEKKETEGSKRSPILSASFSVTTYLIPPGQGITEGATPEAPAEASAQTVAAE